MLVVASHARPADTPTRRLADTQMMKFIVTPELGRLCRWLRLLGFDTVLHGCEDRPGMVIEAIRQGRVILTRIGRAPAHRGAALLRIESGDIKKQIAQVIGALKIAPDEKLMFSRCILCNGLLAAVDKKRVKNKVPPHVFRTQEAFSACPQCRKVYWPGGHWGNALKYLQEIAY